MGRPRTYRSSVKVGKIAENHVQNVHDNPEEMEGPTEQENSSLQAVDTIRTSISQTLLEGLQPTIHEGSILGTLYDDKLTSVNISDQNGNNANPNLEPSTALNLREIAMAVTAIDAVALGASEEGNVTLNSQTSTTELMVPNESVGNVASEEQESQQALFHSLDIIKTVESQSNRVDCRADGEIIHAIQSMTDQPANQERSVSRTSYHGRPAQASSTAPRTSVQAEKGPKEDDTNVLNSLLSPSILPRDVRMEDTGGSTVVSPPKVHISSAAAASQDLTPVGTLKRSSRKRKAPVKLADEHKKVKKEMLEESSNLLSIPQVDSMEDTIVIAAEFPISAGKLDRPGNPETAMKRLEAQRRLATEESDSGKGRDNMEPNTSHSVASIRFSIAKLNPRVETMQKGIAEKQRLVLHTANLLQLKQSVETRTHGEKSDYSRRVTSVPAGRRILRTLHSTEKQDELAALARNIRASSEVPGNVKIEAKRVRGRSAPPMRSLPKWKQEVSSKEDETRARDFPFQELGLRKRRACTEGAMPDIPPTVIQSGVLRLPRETPQPTLKRKRTANTPTPKKGYAERGLHKGREANFESSPDVIVISDSMDISDAMDISDGDTSIDEGGFPFDLPAKLERAEKRPRLESIHPEKRATVVRNIKQHTPKVQVKNEGDNEEETEDLPYDPRYHRSAVSYDAERQLWMVPASCNRCLRIRQFCDRNVPCANCARGGHVCERKEGLAPASKEKAYRGANRENASSAGVKKITGNRSQVIYLSAPSSSESIDESTTETEFEIESQVRAVSPKAAKMKKEYIVKESKIPKKRISNAVTYRGDPDCIWIERPHPQAHKPMCIGVPEVWCTNRQELCESLPYFRSYQSGTYHSGGLMRGYLADGCAGPRDFMNGRVVISHCGGKSTMDEEGNRRLTSSHSATSPGIRDLIGNLDGKWPIIIILGAQCTTSPSRIPHRYCIMDWFKVTAAWPEKDIRSNHVRWMFRFEKLNSSKLGWWAPPMEEYHPSESIELLKACCTTCKEQSPQVYEQGWMCLKQQCPSFWKFNGESPPDKLDYAHSFINCHTPWAPELEHPPAALRPPLATDRDSYYDGGDVARVYWKGMCCPQCGRLSCRESWAGWFCKNCSFKSSPPRTIFEAARLADPHRPIFTGPAIPSNLVQPGVTWERTVMDGMTFLQYHLKDCGTVTHILASEYHNKRPECADWLFKEYQAAEMPFRRYPLKNHKVQGQMLTQHFSFNAGAPYKYIVAVDSTPFEESPRVVTRSLELIQERVKLVHPEAIFNEVLSVGYFEGQRMEFHDDGEKELGETVASLSLGAPARMKFRVKAKYLPSYKLCEPQNAQKQVKAGSGLQDPISVEEVQEEDTLEDDMEDDRERPGAPTARKDTHKEARVKLELKLNHGDVVVMHGREIQRIWEHSVQPSGLFRIAATARWINASQQHDRTSDASEAQVSIKTESRDDLIEGELLQRTLMLGLPEDPLISENTHASASSPTGISSSHHSTDTEVTIPSSPELTGLAEDATVIREEKISAPIGNMSDAFDGGEKKGECEEVLLSLEFSN